MPAILSSWIFFSVDCYCMQVAILDREVTRKSSTSNPPNSTSFQVDGLSAQLWPKWSHCECRIITSPHSRVLGRQACQFSQHQPRFSFATWPLHLGRARWRNIRRSYLLLPHRPTGGLLLNIATRWTSRKCVKECYLCSSVHHFHKTIPAYLIFVIFFTQAKFLEKKIYTKIPNFSR